MDNNQEIERIADELFSVFDKTKTKSVHDNNLRWLGVAKYVQKMILETKLDFVSCLLFNHRKEKYFSNIEPELTLWYEEISQQLSDLKDNEK